MNEKILVTKSSLPEFSEYVDEIRDIWDSHWLTNMGPKHEIFREKLLAYLGVEYIELMTNGHMALEMALQAFDFPLGSEVITTPFTFASTTHAIVRNGLTPVFCDINQHDYCIDADKIEDLINEKTVAIVPVHVYGNVCDVDKIEKIASKYNLKVIYDAAHAFGVKYLDKSIAEYGDVSMFSFHATKVFNSIEGGAVIYKDKELGEKLYDLKNFGIHNAETVASVGANAKMNEFCAAMGICNLRHIDENIAKRKAIYDLYIEKLNNVVGLGLNTIQVGVQSNYAYFPILINKNIYGMDRDELYNLLIQNNIYPRKYFYPLISDFDCYAGIFNSESTPVAKYISDNILTLPIYSELGLDLASRIADIIINKK